MNEQSKKMLFQIDEKGLWRLNILQKTSRTMNTATILIPKRLDKAILQIKNWIEEYANTVGQPLTVTLGGQWDNGQIWIQDAGTLTEAEFQALDNAVSILNDKINHQRFDPWKARVEANKDLQNESAKIDKLFAKAKTRNKSNV